jgi:hypothetical protein
MSFSASLAIINHGRKPERNNKNGIWFYKKVYLHILKICLLNFSPHRLKVYSSSFLTLPAILAALFPLYKDFVPVEVTQHIVKAYGFLFCLAQTIFLRRSSLIRDYAAAWATAIKKRFLWSLNDPSPAPPDNSLFLGSTTIEHL